MSEQRRALQLLCQRYRAVILSHNDMLLRVALADTPSGEFLEALRFASQCQVEVECWPQARLEQYQQQNASPVGAHEHAPTE